MERVKSGFMQCQAGNHDHLDFICYLCAVAVWYERESREVCVCFDHDQLFVNWSMLGVTIFEQKCRKLIESTRWSKLKVQNHNCGITEYRIMIVEINTTFKIDQ